MEFTQVSGVVVHHEARSDARGPALASMLILAAHPRAAIAVMKRPAWIPL